jgi:hypothetical protein
MLPTLSLQRSLRFGALCAGSFSPRPASAPRRRRERSYGRRLVERRLRRTLVVLTLASVITAIGAASAGAVTITQVAGGLDNPRGLAFGPNGALYAAEAGKGGTDFCFDHAGFGRACAGMSGAVTRLWNGKLSPYLRKTRT